MRIHKEERKYLCPDCGYKCKWVNQLKYHMTKHTGECCPLGHRGGCWGCGDPSSMLPLLLVAQLEVGEDPQQLGHSTFLWAGRLGTEPPGWEGTWGGMDPRGCLVPWKWGSWGAY